MTAAMVDHGPTSVDDVLLSLYQHRILTTAQVHQLHTPRSLRAGQRALARLEHDGLAERVRPARRHDPTIWYVSRAGAHLVEAAGETAPRAYRVSAATARGPLRTHTLAVNEVGIAFVRAARTCGDDCVPSAWTHEVAHRIADRRTAGVGSDLLVADAVLHYVVEPDGPEPAPRTWCIELDRGTTPVTALAAKLRDYARYVDYTPRGGGRRQWRSDYAALPELLIVLADQSPARCLRRRAVLARILAAQPHVVRAIEPYGVRVVALDALRKYGPFAPVCSPVLSPHATVDVLGRPA
jgi:hypothetical protein